MEINGNIEEGQKEAVYRSRFLVSSFRSSFRKRSLRNTNGQNFLFKRRQLGTLLPKRSNASYIHRVEYLYFVQIHSRGYSLFLSIRLSTNRSFLRPEKKVNGAVNRTKGQTSSRMTRVKPSRMYNYIVACTHIGQPVVFLTDAFVSTRVAARGDFILRPRLSLIITRRMDSR